MYLITNNIIFFISVNISEKILRILQVARAVSWNLVVNDKNLYKQIIYNVNKESATLNIFIQFEAM